MFVFIFLSPEEAEYIYISAVLIRRSGFYLKSGTLIRSEPVPDETWALFEGPDEAQTSFKDPGRQNTVHLSKVRGWISRRNFEGLEPLLRQTSYLKAHGFLDANKRWGRIEVRDSKRKVEKRQREKSPKQVLTFEN
ncbi:hypothetical protein RclHR1_06470008 [Rhizophagus clarus]|uniref:Uncharacterized protein n=1 Tax=Rhizophagus clarus TaxID=94130 RepID=A0A2Z6S4R0_9GLOM|nr:hypothetical protein RclHR1_06470008 [Rhizophagus clarus]